MSITIDDQGWIKEAIGIYWGPDSFGPFIKGQPKWIVIHSTAWTNGTAEIIGQSWADQTAAGTLGASSHIIIDKDGTYVQGITLLNTASANCCLTDNPNTGGKYARYLPITSWNNGGNQNFNTISIEHCKYDSQENSDILTPQQQATSFAVIKAICEKYGIPKKVITLDDCSKGGIIRHRDIDALNRWFCPGPYPWQELKDFLNQEEKTVTVDFSNESCVDTWEIGAQLVQKNFDVTLVRDDPPFNSWRDEWISGRYRGIPVSPSYPYIYEGKACYAREFTGGKQVILSDSDFVWLTNS